MKLTLLVGTMTGTAQLVAQELELVWDNPGDDGGMQVETLLMEKTDANVFSREGIFLIVTSTYGQGDVPDNAKALYEELKSKRPDLSRVRYGLFGLGDRTYAETFNFGGKRFDELLQELGARRIGERVQHDASSGVLPEEMAAEWGEGWLALVKEAVPA